MAEGEAAMNGAAPDGGMLEHLQTEHHKLNCTLSAIQHRINDPSLGAATGNSDFVAALHALRTELLAHIAEEGIDGCLGEAATRCPSAASQLKSIAADHEAILQAVNDLISSFARDYACAEPLSRRFQALSERLRAYEVAETRLLHYALGSDVADYDVEGNE
jgi:hypothetical protein